MFQHYIAYCLAFITGGYVVYSKSPTKVNGHFLERSLWQVLSIKHQLLLQFVLRMENEYVYMGIVWLCCKCMT